MDSGLHLACNVVGIKECSVLRLFWKEEILAILKISDSVSQKEVIIIS